MCNNGKTPVFLEPLQKSPSPLFSPPPPLCPLVLPWLGDEAPRARPLGLVRDGGGHKAGGWKRAKRERGEKSSSKSGPATKSERKEGRGENLRPDYSLQIRAHKRINCLNG